MRFYDKELRLIGFFFNNRFKWLSFKDQKIYSSERAFKRECKKLMNLGILKTKFDGGNGNGRKLYAIIYESEGFAYFVSKMVTK